MNNSKFWRFLIIGLVLIAGAVLGIQAFSRIGGLAATEAKPVETVVAPAFTPAPEKAAPPAPAAPADPRLAFQQWVKSEYGVTYIKADTSSVFVEFPANKETTKEEMTSLAKMLAEKWGQESKVYYINCRIYLGSTEYTSASWSR
ncbi:MAG: hypothetical protein ACAI35_06990 [Candidatus Methylacidiphilales bacterium]|nr:hypothetical protein [Candidatus Methylacidiphilales bacterium]